MILVIAGATGPASAGDRVDDGKLVHDVIWRGTIGIRTCAAREC